MSKTKAICVELLKEKKQHYYHKTFQRHLDDVERFKDSKEMRFNDRIAEVYIMVMESFKHFKGSEFAGQHFTMEKWQLAVIGIVAGWEHKNVHGKWVRRFHTGLFYMARKNGKTFIGAGLALADMLIRPEPQGEIVALATKREQAKIAWDGVRSMIMAHDDLKSEFHKVGLKLTSKMDETTITTLGRDSSSEDGANYSFAIVDEYHAHPNSDLLDVVKSSMGARKQPFVMIVTTAGFNMGSPLVSEVDHSRDILDGNITDDGYFAFICEPEKDSDPFSIEALRASNPNMGVSISAEYLMQEAQTAKTRPDKLVPYLTKHLNIFTNQAEIFLPIDEWKKCSSLEHTIPDLSEAIYASIGTDLSVSDDWTAVSTTYLFADNTFYTTTKLFIPDHNMRIRAKELKIPLEAWVKQEYVTVTKGSTINQGEVYEYIVSQVEACSEMDIDVTHGYDPYKAKWIVAHLENEASFDNNESIPQGFRTMTEPLNLLLTLVKGHNIIYQDNPALNWMASNLAIIFDSYGNMKPDKSERNRKIDGIASLLNTLCVLIPHMQEEVSESTVYYL